MVLLKRIASPAQPAAARAASARAPRDSGRINFLPRIRLSFRDLVVTEGRIPALRPRSPGGQERELVLAAELALDLLQLAQRPLLAPLQVQCYSNECLAG